MNGQISRAPHVAIVGCGVSGLRCADILLQSGAKVTILEARDRIGGRLHQIESGGYLVDLGANWIHEPNNNPIVQLAKQSNTVTFE
jgi:phytoene dehydrogenase-like protein